MRIKVNDDKQLVDTIRKELQENGGYCPCKLMQTEDTKCMCLEFRQQATGMCHCGLYIKTEE